MTTPILPNYVAPYKPVPQVTPFTYRDGAAMLEKLTDLVSYLNQVVIPFVNDNYAQLASDFETQVNALIEQVNTALATQDAEVDQKIADLTTYVDNAVASIIGSSVTVQDPVMAGIMSNASSATRAVTDALYAGKSATDTHFTAVEAEIALKANQTDLTALTTVVGTKAPQSALDTTNGQVTANTTNITNLDNLTTDPQRLGSATLDARFAGTTGEAVKVKVGGQYAIGSFANLRAGVKNPAATTRVLVLGDSHANGGITTYAWQGVFQRLAYRCGSSDYRRIEDVVSGPPGGMHWWSGSIGGVTTANYYPSSYPAKVAILNPNYVLHLIGSNDWAGNVDINTFKNNLIAVCGSIETANTNAINVLIHGGQRMDTIPTSGISWDAYGAAMSDVVFANPSRRIYVNADDALAMLGLGSDNRAGLLAPDNIHLNNNGNKYFSNILGAIMGIPNDTDYAPLSDVRTFTFPSATVNYTATTQLAEMDIEGVNYPREIIISGVMYATSSHVNNEIQLIMQKQSDGSTVDATERRLSQAGVGASYEVGGVLHIPPLIPVKILMNLTVIAGQTVNVQGAGNFTKANAMLTPC